MSDLIAAYLFLGGAGAGSFIGAACVCLAAMRGGGAGTISFHHWRTTAHRGFAMSLLLLALGTVCLMLDLGRPDKALLLFLSPTMSFITLGSYALVALQVCALVMVTVGLADRRSSRRLVMVAPLVAGSLLALFVMAYTGFLLKSVNAIPLYSSIWLPILFVLSSLAAGGAVLVLCSFTSQDDERVRRRLEVSFTRIDVILVMGELVVTALYLWSVSDHELGMQAVERLLLGDSSLLFLAGFGFCGIVAPVVLDAITLRGAHRGGTAAAAAILTLVGCFCLRLCLVHAGVHSGL